MFRLIGRLIGHYPNFWKVSGKWGVGTLVDDGRTLPKRIMDINCSRFRAQNIGHLRERIVGEYPDKQRHEALALVMDGRDQILLARCIERDISVTGKDNRIDIAQARATASRRAVGHL